MKRTPAVTSHSYGTWRPCGGSLIAAAMAALTFVVADDGRETAGGQMGQARRPAVAEANLACAEGLPGAEGLIKEQCLGLLNQWARQVAVETARNEHWFREQPGYYEFSATKYRMIQLVLTLQQDLGVVYNPAKMSVPNGTDLSDPAFFRDASDVFLCGVLGPARKGTCASLPVLVVALGRRLGYPLRLVATKGHLFARWENPDGKERFNIEAAGQGVDFYPDDYYRSWPFPLSEREIEEEGFLRSLSSDEELALFLELRGYCLIANHRYSEALSALTLALDHRPRSMNLRRLVAHVRSLETRVGGGSDGARSI